MQKEIFENAVPKTQRERAEEEAELKFRKLRADVMLLECKAVGENIDLQKRCDNLCYKSAAIDEFSASIRHIHDAITRLPHTLRDRCGLSAEQADKCFLVIEELLEDLASIKVELKSAQAIDNFATGKHRSRQELLNYANGK